MASLCNPLSFLLVIAFILCNCFTQFVSDAQLIPENEVKTLQVISNNLKNSKWKNITRKSCTDGGRSFNPTFIDSNILSNVTCDCSFNKGTVCHVTDMVLSGNYFNGTIPETFSNLKTLTELRLNGNNISDKIPDFIGNFTYLNILEIQGTSLQGPIPSSFSLLTNLTILRISDLNTTSMAFPNLTGLIYLQYLVLRNCFITDQIPDYIQNLSNLRLLDWSYNQLSGLVPDSMGNLIFCS